jgi:exonuclease III
VPSVCTLTRGAVATTSSVLSVLTELNLVMDISLLNCNLRGLNNLARRRSIHRFINNHNCNIVVFQETKLGDVTPSIVSESIGTRFVNNFIFKAADGTHGGILIACSEDFDIQMDQQASSEYFITGTITDRTNNTSWSLIAVYGPQHDHEKILFMQEIRRIKPLVMAEWAILGDFNLIKSANEKSNSNLNLRMMGRFRHLIDVLELREIHLVGRRFT